MQILCLVRNFVPSHQQVISGGWNIADCVSRSYDVEGMHVGTVAAGRIGLAVLRRMKPFGVHLHYTDRHRLPTAVEQELGLTFHKSAADMVKVCDVVTINCPLHPETEHMFNAKLIATMKRGSYIVNTARGKICDRNAIAGETKNSLWVFFFFFLTLRCRCASLWPTRWLCRRCVLPAACSAGPPLAVDAASRHDAAH